MNTKQRILQTTAYSKPWGQDESIAQNNLQAQANGMTCHWMRVAKQ
jgi:hypothetical protein